MDVVEVVDVADHRSFRGQFRADVRARWADRWSTRVLLCLAEVGARIADLDRSDLGGQVAALLLHSTDEASAYRCRWTVGDLLDLDDETICEILAELERRVALPRF